MILHSLRWFWGCLVWHLWVGRARHPGPVSGIGVEVFNISGWLTNGDYAIEAGVDFLVVVEHRLVSARARGECRRLRDKGISSIWAPASQEFSPVGNAGVGVVALRGAPLALPSVFFWVGCFLLVLVGSCIWLCFTVIMVLILMRSA